MSVSVCLSVWMFVCPSFCLSVCGSAGPLVSFCLAVYLFVCVCSACLSVCDCVSVMVMLMPPNPKPPYHPKGGLIGIQVRVLVYMSVCTYACTSVCVYVFMCLCVYVSVCVCGVCVCVSWLDRLYECARAHM